MTFIVHGATGAQGGPVAAALARAGRSVTAAVRTPQSYDGDAVAVDYADPGTLAAAYRGAEGVFVHLPLGAPEQQIAHARAIVQGVEDGRPGRVVVSTSGYPFAEDGTDDGPVSVLVRGLRGSGVPTAVIAPRLYLENLLLPPVTASAREHGVLPYPLRTDYPVSWSSHLDVADVAVRLLDDHAPTGTVAVGALPGLLGADLATGFAEHLGRDVRFEAQDPDDFGTAVAPIFGAEAIAPVVASYRWRATQPGDVIAREDSAQERLGLQPRSVAQWLRDVGA